MRLRAALVFVAALALTPSAQAETQVERLRGAESAETRLDYAGALGEYRRSIELDPGSRLARRARARVEYLEARSEGSFAPLVRLEKARRATPDPRGLEELSHEVDAFPSGRVRREARAYIAETLALRLKLPSAAIVAYERWLDEPGLEDAEFLRATNGLAKSRARLGDLGRSLETLRAAGLGASAEARAIELAQVRRWAGPLAWGTLAVFALLALAWGGARALSPARLRRVISLRAVAVLAWVLAVPLALATRHRPETLRTLLLFVPAAACVVALAALWRAGAGAPGARRRFLMAALGVLAQLAVAYLALDRSGTLLGILLRG